MSTAAEGALAGIRVVDLTRILAGPLCTMMLGDMGADVIKVEPPGHGDDTRHWGPPFVGDDAAYFLGVNRNKRSLTLNMAVPAGQKVLAGLIEKADVLIDNFRIGTLEKWGFTPAWLDAHAPRLVRCCITGYGTSGPKAALPGYDFTLQAVGVPCGRINTVAEAIEDPHTAARRMVETVEHPAVGALKLLGIPFKFSDTTASVRRPPPMLGQHTAEILAAELGLDAEAIAELREQKVI
jgi:crotonobetainyl-CoA:carnitine CoA-transferase CaiB-like acyl-CoA transferase